MFVKTKVWTLLAGLALIATLAGCSAPTAVPTPVPTIDTQPTFDAVSTHAAETVIANLTQNAPTATATVPTETPSPTNTPAPSNTPAPTSTPTRVFIPWTNTPSPTIAAYACTVTDVSPKSSDTLKVDADFDGKWSLKNTGTKTWSAGNTDIRYKDGTKFQTSGDLVDVTSDVAPNGTYTVTIDMKAPSSDGTFSANWGVYFEDGSNCNLALKFNVTK